MRCTRLFLAALLLLIPMHAHAQKEPLDTHIATLREEIVKAPLDQQATVSAKLLPLIAKRFGENSDEYVEALQSHATNLSFAKRNAEALRIMERVIAIVAERDGPNSYAAAMAQQNLATSLRLNGFTEQAVEPYRRYVIALTEEAYGCGRIKPVPAGKIVMGCVQDEKDLGDALANFGMLLDELGRAEEGEALFRTTIARFEPRWAGCEGLEWGTDCDAAAFDRRDFMSDYARFLKRIGKAEAAKDILEENTRARVEALPACTDDDCRADYWLLNDFNNWREAVASIDEAEGHALAFKWLPVLAAEPIYERGAAPESDSFDRSYRERLDESLSDFAKAAVAAGKRDEALAMLTPLGKAGLVGEQDQQGDFEAQLAANEKAFSEAGYYDHAARAAILQQKADILRKQVGEEANEYWAALRDIAWELKSGDDDEATDRAFRVALAAARQTKGDADYRSWLSLESYADWLIAKGRRSDAITITRDVLSAPGNDMTALYADPAKAATLASGLGTLHDRYGSLNELHADLAEWLLASGGDPKEALFHARHAAVGKRAYRRAFGFARTDEAGFADATDDNAFFNKFNRPYGGFQTLYADALWEAGLRDASATATAFLALQEAQMGSTSRAVARAAAERAIARGGVTALLEERRSLDRKVEALIATRPPADASSGDAYQRWSRDNFNEERRLTFRRDQIDQEIQAAAPGYFELIRPQPLSVAEAQAQLAPDEAFLMLVPSQFGTHGLLVTRDTIRWHRSDLKEGQLGLFVRRLLWDVGASIDVSPDEEERWSLEGEGDFPFDRTTAWRLYEALIAPFAADIAGKRHLFTASSGAISSLPLGILVTETPTGADGEPQNLRSTRWLADKIALLQLPSLQSLQLLRAVETRNKTVAGNAMVGFGDPILDGAAQTRGTGGGRKRRTRSSAGLSVDAGLQLASGDGPALADPDALRKLARLPGTEAELKAMQSLLGADKTRLFLADAATEANMKRRDLTGLSVLFLATHGLVAGEVSGVAEPGLVFTPPAKASTADDGLLTASEVASLRLGARWVILSACNTAAGDGTQGAPGLSGLARSFFFAGAESLLASHWPVRDDVAAVLTVKLFELLRADPQLSRAEALQRAAKQIRDDPRADDILQSWAHPSAWAPFSLIGDGIS